MASHQDKQCYNEQPLFKKSKSEDWYDVVQDEERSKPMDQIGVHVPFTITPMYNSTLRKYHVKNHLSLMYSKERSGNWHTFLQNIPTEPLILKRKIDEHEKMEQDMKPTRRHKMDILPSDIHFRPKLKRS